MCESRPSDQGTAEPAANADPLDFRNLVSEHYQNVYRYAYRLCGSEADAEDLVQQTYLIAQTKLPQLRDRARARAWLFAVLRSCFLKSRRRQRPTAAAVLELAVEEIPEHRLATGTIDRDEMRQALDALPDDFRLVLLMYYFEDLSYKEIAERLQLPIGTVMSRLSRAKGQLRQRLLAESHEPCGARVPPR